jgi:hypothetical protein
VHGQPWPYAANTLRSCRSKAFCEVRACYGCWPWRMMRSVAAEYALVSPRLKAEAWTKTETSYGELLVSCAQNRGVLPGQRGGG